ncbi:MAG: hypothetical protein WED10_11795 [Brumimicrobium sp.]
MNNTLKILLLISLFTSCNKEVNHNNDEVSSPKVSTVGATEVNKTEAKFIGEVIDDGNDPKTERGICWSTHNQPSIDDNYESFGYGNGKFIIKASYLTISTKYFFRAFSKNKAGENYGEILNITTDQKELGDSLNGGIIVYIFKPGDIGYVENEFHGIIADFSHINNSIWGCESYPMNTSTEIGTAIDNTNHIVNNCFAQSFAAKSCHEYENNGYSDWVLPSIDDLEQIFQNENMWNVIFIGGFWSSSQRSGNTAWALDATNNNNIVFYNKDSSAKYFPVKYF